MLVPYKKLNIITFSNKNTSLEEIYKVNNVFIDGIIEKIA